MKQQYMKQVKCHLNLSHKARKEVMRDLDEAFTSALEHGETEQQLIERLGTPEEFSKNVQEQFGTSYAENRNRRKQICIVVAILISIFAFAAAYLIHITRPAKNLIGQADAATTIQISGSSIDLFFLMVLLGCIALIIAICLIIRNIHKKD